MSSWMGSMRHEPSRRPKGDAPVVSVVIPAYNSAATLGHAIESAQCQTLRDIEIIIVDDASRDYTQRIAHTYTKDDRVKVIRNIQNLGVAQTRDVGGDVATGEWIAILDSDDMFAPDRLERLVKLAEARNADMVADNMIAFQVGGAQKVLFNLDQERRYTAAEFVEANTGPRPPFWAVYRGRAAWFSNHWLDRMFPRQVSLGFMKPLIRRSFIAAHRLRRPPSLHFGEDYVHFLSVLAKGANFWMAPWPGYYYRVVDGTLTDVARASDLRTIIEFDKQLLSTAPPDLAAALRRHIPTLERWYFYEAFTRAIKARDPQVALRLLRESPRHVLTECAMHVPALALKYSGLS